MSTNYNGDPTATQAPALSPVQGAVPELVLPADGDPDNAASVAQAFKVLADYIAMLQDPYANPASVIQFITGLRARNGRLLTRWVIDNIGLLDGKTKRWRDDFEDVALAAGKSAVNNGAFSGRWLYSISGDAAGGNITSFGAAADDPASGSPDSDLRSSGIFITSRNSGSAATYESIETVGQTVADANTSVAMQWDMKILQQSTGVQEDFAGIITGSMQGITGTTISNAPFGFGFIASQALGNPTHWYVYSRQTGAGGPTLVDTGVVATGRQRMRIQWEGANNDPTSTHRVSFFINGGTVAASPISADLTGAGGASPATLRPVFRHSDAVAISWSAIMAMQWADVPWAGDVKF